MTAISNPQRRLDFVPKDLEGLLRFGGAFALVVYGIGLLTTNLYLTRIGVSDFSLLRTRFILCGITMLMPLFLNTIFYIGVFFSLFQKYVHRIHVSSKDIIAVGLLSHFISLLYLLLLANNIREIVIFLVISSILICIGSMLAVLSLVSTNAFLPNTEYIREHLLADRDKSLIGLIIRKIHLIMLFLSISTIIISYSLLFSLYVFTKIPEQLGGGSPRSATIILSNDYRREWDSLGLVSPSSSIAVASVSILWEGENIYAIRSKSTKNFVNNVVIIDKDEIISVTFDGT